LGANLIVVTLSNARYSAVVAGHHPGHPFAALGRHVSSGPTLV